MATFEEGLSFASGGEPSLLVWSPHSSFLKNVGASACYDFPMVLSFSVKAVCCLPCRMGFCAGWVSL